jgi:hypothetical protein
LTGPPIAGALLTSDNGSYTYAILFTAITMLCGGLFFVGCSAATRIEPSGLPSQTVTKDTQRTKTPLVDKFELCLSGPPLKPGLQSRSSSRTISDDPWESTTMIQHEHVVEFLRACYNELKQTGIHIEFFF